MIIWFFFFDLLILIFSLRFLYKYSINGTSLYMDFIVLTLPALVLGSCDIYKRIWGLPRWLSGKESACQCRRHKRHGLDAWVRKIPWRRAWQPIPIFLPGESHGQRSLASYSPRVTKSQTWLSIQKEKDKRIYRLPSLCAEKIWIRL